ncbi:MAG: T9SS type A sorting domain-containing protein [Saprospiraceae bacterium]|nr:T9SS type A sorting domain-containing protein [Saprospiraceae bacterium]
MKTFPLFLHFKDMPFGIKRLSLYSQLFIILVLGFSSSKLNAQSFNWLWLITTWVTSSAESVVFDPSGNFYATGHYAGAAPNWKFYLDNNYDIYLLGDGAFVAKYNGAGDCIWAKQLGDTSTYGTSISIDDAGNVYSTGTFEGIRDFDPGSGIFNLTSAGSTDIYISKLNSSGDFVWAKSIGGSLADGNFRSCMAINPANGDLYLTGYFNGTADFDPGSGTSNLTSFGGDDIFISSLDASGNLIWAGHMGGSGSDIGKSIARDDDGDLVSTGKFTGTADFNPGSGTVNLSGPGTYISKLDGDGGFVFAKKIGNDTGNAIAVDGSNNIYTAGSFTGSQDFDPSVAGEFLLTANGTNFFISKLDDSGNFVWARLMGEGGYAEVNSIAVENSGDVFTTGLLGAPSDFDPDSTDSYVISGYDDAEVFISKLDASGNFIYAESVGGPDISGYDAGNCIAVDNAGNAIVAGQWNYLFEVGPFMAYSGQFNEESVLAFIAKFGTEVASPLGVTITSSTNVLCYGQSTGSATAETSGGYPPYIYDWSNGESGAEITDLAVGTYTVTVTDNNGITATAQVVITEPPLLEFETPLINDVSCNGESDGSIEADVSGGVSPYTYTWSNGASLPSIFNLSAGTYAVTVTDNNGCTQFASYQVDQPDQLEISLVSLDNETCVGSNDGEITISITGGTNPSNAVWSNGYTGTTNTGLDPGIYSVTITDNNDCTQTADYTILPGIPVEINLVLIHDVSCAGGTDGNVSVTGSSGVPPYVYLWSNGETGSFIDTLVSGLYSVTTSDSYGCFSTAEYMINEPSAITAQITQSSENQCAGDSTADLSAMASGGTSPFTALWSNGVTGFENVNLGAGIYSVTITDANACISLLSDTISEPLAIDVNAVGTNETGSGANDGTATSNPTGGIPPFNFLWNTGDTISTLSGLSPGTYTVTITDTNGCIAEGTALVNAFGCALDIIEGADLNICEKDTITIQPTVMGGSGPLSYLWSDGSTGESLSVHQGGEYCVTISDEANCQDLDCVVVNEIVIPSFTCPATDESTPGANDGAIQCDSLPGIISYLWSNDSTTSSIEGLSPGQYCVTVTEQNGCMASQCFYVQPGDCQLEVTSTVTGIDCAGNSTGSITLSAEHGTEPLIYQWSNGATTSFVENLYTGIYTVTVSDANGCVDLNSFTISEPLPLTFVIDSLVPVDESGSGLLWISVSGGSPPYTYQWTDAVGVIYTTEDLNNLEHYGLYSLMLLDDKGCLLHYVDMSVAVKPSPSFESIKVYPVPAKDVLIIDTEKLVSEVLISGVDGRVFKRLNQPESNRLDIADLGPGWYVLRIRMGNTWYVARMVK